MADSVQCFFSTRSRQLSEKKIIFWSRKILRRLRYRRLLPQRSSVLLQIAVVGKMRMTKLKYAYLRQHHAADVLSFPANSKNGDLGEIVLCPEVIQRQAKRHGESLDVEWVRLLVHGCLHLVGWDHRNRKEALKMFALQEKILGELFLRGRRRSITNRTQLLEFIEERRDG